MKARILTLLVMLSILTLTGCGKVPPEGDTVLVSIGDTEITVAEFNERIDNLPEQYREVIRRRKGEYIQEFVNDTLLYQEAMRKGLAKDEDVQKVIQEARKKILIARLLKDEVDDTIDITEDDMIEFYEKNSDRYMTPEVMRVSHILVPTREEAEELLNDINSGARFEDVARAKSVDPTAQRGGDIGYFPKGQLMPEFEAACDGLSIDQISGVTKTKLGYHIIKMTDRRDPELRPREQVNADIKARIRDMKRREKFNSMLKDLRENTKIEINEKALSSMVEAKEDEGSTAKSK